MEAGACVRIPEANKRRHHAKAGTSGYTYATPVHETHGRLGEGAKEQIRILPDEACSHSSGNRSACTRELKTEHRVTMVKGNALVFQSRVAQEGVSEGLESRKWSWGIQQTSALSPATVPGHCTMQVEYEVGQSTTSRKTRCRDELSFAALSSQTEVCAAPSIQSTGQSTAWELSDVQHLYAQRGLHTS